VPEPVVAPSSEASEPVTISTDDMMRGVALDDDMLDYTGTADEKPDDENADVTLDWRSLPINPQSFLGQWMEHAETYYPNVPKEYFLFVGLQAIGLAMGHWVTSTTLGRKLTAQLMITLVGPSGGGKTTAVSELMKMFRNVMGPKFDEDLGTGVKIVSSPASSEALLKSIYTEIEDTTSPIPGTKRETGVTAWLYEDEFATFVDRASRRGGGTLKTRLMQLYDFSKHESMTVQELVIDEFSLTSGRRVLHDTFFAGCFTTQTDAVRAMMTRVDLVSGFLNRIIPVFGPDGGDDDLDEFVIVPPSPPHQDAYRHLWDRCRSGAQHIPFTDEALKFATSHPVRKKLIALAKEDSMFARGQHMALKIAMLLAVNNAEKQIDEKYIAGAFGGFGTYYAQVIGKLRTAVIGTEFDDAADNIVEFVRAFYNKHKRWPTGREWKDSRSYKKYDSVVRLKSLELLYAFGTLVRVKLAKGKATQEVFVIPEGEWSDYSSAHGKKFNFEEFYK
jgi:hypothetical protein